MINVFGIRSSPFKKDNTVFVLDYLSTAKEARQQKQKTRTCPGALKRLIFFK